MNENDTLIQVMLAVTAVVLVAALVFWAHRTLVKRDTQRHERANMWKEAQTNHLTALLNCRKGLEATVAAVWYVKTVFNCSLRDAVALAAPEHLERFDGKPDKEPTATEVQRTFNSWAKVVRDAQIGNVIPAGATSSISQKDK